jgi:hypothetical protein
MNLKSINFEDLYDAHYAKNGETYAAIFLNSVREGISTPETLEIFPPVDEIQRSNPLMFGPVGELLKFYSLLEIALVIKCIPEPEYTDPFWRDTTAILGSPLFKSYQETNYPILLPQFLMGRLEGRLHLEEEGVDTKFTELFDIFLSFTSLISRWQHPDVELFSQFVLSHDSDPGKLHGFRKFVADRNEFMARVLTPLSEKGEFVVHLMRGFSRVLIICEDLDRLLGDAEPFPLLQSALWNYHADLFWGADKRFPWYLIQLVESFLVWVRDEQESEDELSVAAYVQDVKQFVDRLASGTYGSSLSPQMLRPLVMA